MVQVAGYDDINNFYIGAGQQLAIIGVNVRLWESVLSRAAAGIGRAAIAFSDAPLVLAIASA